MHPHRQVSVYVDAEIADGLHWTSLSQPPRDTVHTPLGVGHLSQPPRDTGHTPLGVGHLSQLG